MIKKHFFFIQKGLGTNEKKMIEIATILNQKPNLGGHKNGKNSKNIL